MFGTLLLLLTALPLAQGLVARQDPLLSGEDPWQSSGDEGPTERVEKARAEENRTDFDTSIYDPEAYRLAWYRECGCTGFAIEAVYLIQGITQLIGEGRVRTNRCAQDCKWSAATQALLDKVAVDSYEDLVKKPTTFPLPPAMVIVVVHGVGGVCALPGDWLSHKAASVWEASKGIMRVSRTMYESDKLTLEQVLSCNRNFDAVWVPSQQGLQTFKKSGVLRKRLAVLRESLDVDAFKCDSRPSAPFKSGVKALDAFLEAREKDTTTFLSIFKWEDRKNPKQLLETFARTFAPNETAVDGSKVRLVAHINAAFDRPYFEEYMANLPPIVNESINSGQIYLNTERIPIESMADFYHAVDAFVLPTHGEGWGLPLAEAMASGLPTIATGWGGQTEFMSEDNSYLLPYTMGQAWSGQKWAKGLQWADPDVDSLRQAMLDVVQDPRQAQIKGRKACKDVRSIMNPSTLAWDTHQNIISLQKSFSSMPWMASK